MPPTALIDELRVSRPAVDPLEERIVEAMLECIGQWGIAKTTAEDIARTAGVSRATLYRAFPGGKDVALDALLRHEVVRFFDLVTARLDAADDLEDLVVLGIVEAARFLREHRALGYVLEHEPERILPAFAFHRLDRTFAVATSFTAPHLLRFVDDPDEAEADAEWIVRILFSYVINPTPALDLADATDVRRFVRTYVLPALVEHRDPPATASKER